MPDTTTARRWNRPIGASSSAAIRLLASTSDMISPSAGRRPPNAGRSDLQRKSPEEPADTAKRPKTNEQRVNTSYRHAQRALNVALENGAQILQRAHAPAGLIGGA